MFVKCSFELHAFVEARLVIFQEVGAARVSDSLRVSVLRTYRCPGVIILREPHHHLRLPRNLRGKLSQTFVPLDPRGKQLIGASLTVK